MINRYKISDLAKDFNMSSKDIIALVNSLTGEEKKSSAVLIENEIAMVFDALTKQNAVKSFDEYFATGAESRAAAAKKRQDEKDKKLAEQMAILEQLKAAAAAAEGKPAPKPAETDKKAEEKPAKKEVKKETEKPADKKAEPKKETTVEQKKENKKAEPKKDTNKKEKSNEKVVNKKEPKREEKAYDGPLVAPPKKEKKQGEAPNRGPAQLRHVDTRTSNVNIDKYNEKYENIAPANSMRDNFSRKQKIKQKSQDYRRPQGAKRETEADKLRRMQLERIKKTPITVTVGDEITVGELAAAMKKTAAEVIKELFKLGMPATVNQVIDYDTAEIVVTEMGAKIERAVVVTIEEKIMDVTEDSAEDLKPRSPVVVVMGHVDHGKTSLLDAIRDTAVTDTEAGGITQHIGAYRVKCNGEDITFLDTPGHAAFTAMRQRGAMATDIAILVVAADDGIMPQTVEAINHAKAANVQIIVAINKMDKPDANPDRVLQQLTEYSLVPEEWGGDIICVPVSAKTHQGIDKLLENVLLVAEMLELKANPNRKAKGVVIEARLDKGRGPVATVLVRSGTLHKGDTILCGLQYGRVRSMRNENGKELTEAGPSIPVEVFGLSGVPSAGDEVTAVADERKAREVALFRQGKFRELKIAKQKKAQLASMFKESNASELKVVLKADTQGSVEAISDALLKLGNEEVQVKIIGSGVGGITANDATLAAADNAVVIGFNVRADGPARQVIDSESVDLHYYSVIYDLIDDVKKAMSGLLKKEVRENFIGYAEVRDVFRHPKYGAIAGCMVVEGMVKRSAPIRVLRDNTVIFEGELDSLRRFKDDVSEVKQNTECGICVKNYQDVRVGDRIECFEKVEVARTLD